MSRNGSCVELLISIGCMKCLVMNMMMNLSVVIMMVYMVVFCMNSQSVVLQNMIGVQNGSIVVIVVMSLSSVVCGMFVSVYVMLSSVFLLSLMMMSFVIVLYMVVIICLISFVLLCLNVCCVFCSNVFDSLWFVCRIMNSVMSMKLNLSSMCVSFVLNCWLNVMNFLLLMLCIVVVVCSGWLRLVCYYLVICVVLYGNWLIMFGNGMLLFWIVCSYLCRLCVCVIVWVVVIVIGSMMSSEIVVVMMVVISVGWLWNSWCDLKCFSSGYIVMVIMQVYVMVGMKLWIIYSVSISSVVYNVMWVICCVCGCVVEL